jgi:hypothetical protein
MVRAPYKVVANYGIEGKNSAVKKDSTNVYFMAITVRGIF